MDWFEIFKVGKHTDSAGHTREWDLKDLEEIASSYDPVKHEAPIVIGHPEMDSPAYGWIEALKTEGDKLLAKPKQVVDQLKDWVRKGLYKKVSIAIYPDLTLRHVGFLGGTPPAIKGLKQATFGDKKPAWVIESDLFMDPYQQETVKSIFQRMRDWMIDKFSLEEADKIISSYDIEALKPEPKETTAVTQSFSSDPNKKEGGTKMTLKDLVEKMKAIFSEAEKDLTPDPGAKFTEADLQAAEKKGKDAIFAEVEKEKKEKEAAQKKLKEIEDQKRKEGIASFCETLCKDGKLTPALRKIIEPIMISVSNPPLQGEGKGGDGLIEFSDGTKKSALDGIKDFLTELPKVVTFKEVTPNDGPKTGGSAAEKLSALTKTKMEAKKDLSYTQAFAEVQRENIELARELLEEIRPQKK